MTITLKGKQFNGPLKEVMVMKLTINCLKTLHTIDSII